MSRRAEPKIMISRKLFRVLVGLQAHYGSLLNMHDGGARRAVYLPARLKKHLSDREIDLRKRIGEFDE